MNQAWCFFPKSLELDSSPSLVPEQRASITHCVSSVSIFRGGGKKCKHDQEESGEDSPSAVSGGDERAAPGDCACWGRSRGHASRSS